MNWFDITLAVIAALFGLQGLWKGAIKGVFGVAGLLGGIALAGHYYQVLATLLSSGEAVWSFILAYAIIVLTTLAVADIAGSVVSGLVHVSILAWVDRLLGFMLGITVGAMLCAAALAILGKYFPGMETAVAQSVLARFLMKQFPLLLALLPSEFDFIKDFFMPSGRVY